MYTHQLNNLPQALRPKAISLAPLGLSSWSLSVTDTVSLLNHFEGKVVLGGDLYIKRDTSTYVWYGNWSYEPANAVTDPQQSVQTGLDYLNCLPDKDVDVVIVDLVIQD